MDLRGTGNGGGGGWKGFLMRGEGTRLSCRGTNGEGESG